ncbi:hypothetical protein ACFZ8E_27120 [Methylobacterium sp. HMF5984]|uniref:hypothetical protein n=1 Tax=Methylobacterium sp. HMF5984 TaxID=3367370 RepID=UPI0038528732
MRNPLKLPTTNLKPTLRERFASMKAKAAGLATETSQGRPASPAANPASAPLADAVSAAIDRHTQAYGERLYAEAYRMTALVAEYEGFARVSDEAVTREDEVGLPLPDDLYNAIDRVRHFTNQGREDIVRHAMALPATTLLGFGLKAQILEHDAAAIWDGGEDDLDHLRCQALLRGLIAAAGLSPIPRLEVTSDEIRGWLADPKSAPGGLRVKA